MNLNLKQLIYLKLCNLCYEFSSESNNVSGTSKFTLELKRLTQKFVCSSDIEKQNKIRFKQRFFFIDKLQYKRRTIFVLLNIKFLININLL